MQGVRKAFDPLLQQWATRAERELRLWLRGRGYEYSTMPDGEMGIDGLCVSPFERFYVEVERRSSHAWKGGKFPFRTVHVPERRARYGDSNWLLFVVRSDVREALIVFPQSLTPERLKEVSNRYVRSGEKFFDIPLIETLPIDLTETSGDPIAVMNARRIRKLASTSSAMQALGDVPPYGVDADEWRTLKDTAEEPLTMRATCYCSSQPKREVESVQYRNKIEVWCSTCGRLYGLKDFQKNFK